MAGRHRKNPVKAPLSAPVRARRILVLCVPGVLAGAGLAFLVFFPRAPGCPLAADADMRLAEEALAAGNPREAVRRFESAQQRHPERPEPLLGLVRVFMAMRQMAPALRAAEEACAVAPENAACRVALGKAHEAAGDFEKAHMAYEHAMRLDPADPEPPFLLGRLAAARIQTEVALAYYRRALALDPSHGPAAHYLAGQYMDSGAFDEAERLLTAALARHPETVGLRLNLAHTYLRKGDPAGAAREFRRALPLAPDMAEPRYHLGCALESLGEDHEALAAFHEALARDRYLAPAWYALAQLQARLGQADAAAEAFKRFEEARALLDQIHLFESRLENEPSNVALLVGLATALLRRGDPRAAYVRLMRALELDPNNPRVRKLFDEAAQAARKLDSAGS